LESEINAIDVQENLTKRQALTNTILPPERAVSNTSPSESVTLQAPEQDVFSAPPASDQLNSVPMDKEPNA